jgi:basic membrane lipoprotein Med (substrate-binding protein (PBP1-ABC) superfamily)
VPATVFGTRDFSTPYVMLYHDSELHDNSFNEQSYNATQKFVKDKNKSAGYYDIDPLNEKTVSSNTNQYFENGTEIVVANTFNLIP